MRRYWISAVLGFAAGLSHAAEVDSKLDTKTISEVEIQAEGPVDVSEVQELLGIKKGDPFRPEDFDLGISRVAETLKYSKVEGTFDPEDGQVSVVVKVLSRLESIQIEISTFNGQEKEWLQDEVDQILGLTKNELLRPDAVQEARDRVISRLKERGYLDPQVVMAVEQKSGRDSRNLLVSVKPGKRAEISEFVLKNFSVSDVADLRSSVGDRNEIFQLFSVLNPLNLMGVGRGQSITKLKANIPYDQISIGQAIQTWSQLARTRGFYDFQVKSRVVEGTEQVVLELELNRGPQYHIRIQGCVAYWERALRAQILDRSIRLGLPFAVGEAETLLKKTYRTAGFAKMELSTKVEERRKDDVDQRFVTFKLVEGVQYLLGDVHLDGADDEAREALTSSLVSWRTEFSHPLSPTVYDELALKAGLSSLIQRIQSKGYLQARLLGFNPQWHEDSRVVDLEIPVQLGRPFRVRGVSVEGNIALSKSELESIVDLKPGDIVDPSRVQDIAQRLLARYQELGFMSVNIANDQDKIFAMIPEAAQVDITLEIHPGPYQVVGLAIVQGLERVKERIVKREMGDDTLKTAGPWSPRGRMNFEQNLLSLGVFSSARVEPMGTRQVSSPDPKSFIETQERDVRILVAERPGGAIEFGPGFRTDLGAIGFFEFNYRNLGGWNRSVQTRAQISRKLQNYEFPEQKYTLAYYEPFLFDHKLSFRFNTGYSKTDETVFARSQKVAGFNSEEVIMGFAVEKEIFPKLRWVQNLYTIDLPRIFDIVQNPTKDRQTYRIATIGTALSYDRRDNVFTPTRGFFSSSSIEYASPYFGGDQNANFFLFKQVASTYIPALGQLF